MSFAQLTITSQLLTFSRVNQLGSESVYRLITAFVETDAESFRTPFLEQLVRF